MSIGKKTKNENKYSTFKGIPKVYKLLKLFGYYGFYIALAMCICEFIMERY